MRKESACRGDAAGECHERIFETLKSIKKIVRNIDPVIFGCVLYYPLKILAVHLLK